MPKLRVYQLARELNRDNSEIIRELQHMGVPVTSHSNTVEDRLADKLRRELGVFVPDAGKKVAAGGDDIVAVEVPDEVEAVEVAAEPVPVEAELPAIEVKAEPKVEPTVEEKAPPVEVKVATPPPPPPAPPAPAAPPKTEQPAAAQPAQPAPPQPPQPQQPKFTPQGGRIIPPPTRIGPAVPPVLPTKPVEPPQEQRKTMQQIVQERLRQEHRLPTPPPPGQQRRPYPPPRPMGPGQGPGQRHPSGPGFQNRGAAPGAPAGQRPWVRPGTPPPAAPTEQRRPQPAQRVDRNERYERQAEKRLESPYARPQPKPEIQREFRKVTLTEGLTVKDLAEKLEVLAKDMQKKLMDRGVFATINQTLDKEMAKTIAKDFNAEAEFVTFEEKVMLDAV